MNASSSFARARLQVEPLEHRNLPSTASYVDALYTNLLHRPPSAPEEAAWVAQLNAGVPAVQVANAFEATSQVAQTTLRSVVGQHEMDDLLAQRDKLNTDLQRILDQSTEAWGIKVSTVEIKDVDLDESMIRAMAKQAEAERTRRAKIIHAEGEAQAAQQLVEAAKALAQQPSALQLRYLQTLADISHERTQIIVFPLPLDLIKPFLGPHGE